MTIIVGEDYRNKKRASGLLTVLLISILPLSSCVREIDPNQPPENLPGAVLYFSPKQTYWIVCAESPDGYSRCEFYNPDGDTVAFSCAYALPEPLSRKNIDHITIGSNRELIFDEHRIVRCLSMK